MAVFIDGKMHNVHDGLAFELHEKFTCDNVLKRVGKAAPKAHFIQCFLTEYDQSIFKNKVKEDGVEHSWGQLPENLLAQQHLQWVRDLQSSFPAIVHSSVWQTLFQMDNQYARETVYRIVEKHGEADEHRKKRQEEFQKVKLTFREGRNELGQQWQEDKQVNESKKYSRWNFWSQESKDGFTNKWGQWRESSQGELETCEKWCEVLNVHADYWERKAERYTNHIKNQANIIDVVVLKSGYQEFKNNRNLVDMEEWREYSDGRVVRKKLHDNGYGVRVKTESGQKMHKQQFEKVIKSMSQEKPSGNVLEHFLTDEDGSQLQSLQHYLSLPDQMLEYDYENRIVEDMGLNRVTEVKKGKELMTEEEYRSKVAKGLVGDENDEQIWLRKEDG